MARPDELRRHPRVVGGAQPPGLGARGTAGNQRARATQYIRIGTVLLPAEAESGPRSPGDWPAAQQATGQRIQGSSEAASADVGISVLTQVWAGRWSV